MGKAEALLVWLARRAGTVRLMEGDADGKRLCAAWTDDHGARHAVSADLRGGAEAASAAILSLAEGREQSSDQIARWSHR